MPFYRYKAMDPTGRLVNGQLEALHFDDLEVRLQRQKLELIRGRAVRGRRWSIGAQRIKRRELIDFTLSLGQLLGAGVPMMEALEDLRESLESGYFREMVSSLIDRIDSGQRLSEAMASFPNVFSASYLSLIRAGEESGEMGRVLEELYDSLRWQDEMIAQTKKALSYPLFVAVVLTGVIFFLMIYLVPQLTAFISNMGQEIPFYTLALIAVSDFFVANWQVLLLVPLMLFPLLRFLVRHDPRMQRLWDSLKLRTPVLGAILMKISLARFLNNLALMYAAGVPVTDALKTASLAVDNRVVREGLEATEKAMSEGKGLYEAFTGAAMFPSMVLRMIKVGETSGDLSGSLANAIYFYKRDVTESIGRLQTLIEPIMTVILGLILGWVMISVMGPIYDLVSKIRT